MNPNVERKLPTAVWHHDLYTLARLELVKHVVVEAHVGHTSKRRSALGIVGRKMFEATSSEEELSLHPHLKRSRAPTLQGDFVVVPVFGPGLSVLIDVR